ncbi:MAG: folate-binding Fe/S cluster repair protein [Acinetobacter sp.]
MSDLAFIHYQLQGIDAQKFLQGQVTLNVEKQIIDSTRYTVICDLKGRIQFGLWLKKISSDQFEIVVTADQSEEFAKHIRKYGAFSKITLIAQGPVFPVIQQDQTIFTTEATDITAWKKLAIEQGQAFITAQTAHEFQPQELRLHQRDGVHFDKGCYLGQEIVARLWFKAKPKHWLHLVSGAGATPTAGTKLGNDAQVVNSLAQDNGFVALVTAKPESLDPLGLRLLDLPTHLNGDVARPK